jgi:hypothetical protein
LVGVTGSTALMISAQCGADVGRLPSSAHGGRSDAPLKVIHVRKIVRHLFGIGRALDDEAPLRLGATRTTLLWRKGWRWNESSPDAGLPLGLQGGPLLNLDLPVGRSERGRSIAARFCGLRYLFADKHTSRIIDELAQPRMRRYGLEVALQLNVAF